MDVIVEVQVQGSDSILHTLFFFINLFYFILFIYFWLLWVFVAACRLFSGCGERGLFFITACGLLIAVASLVAEHGL